MRRLLSMAVLAACVACSKVDGADPDGGTTLPDASSEPDAGNTPDAGDAPDGGDAPDAGEVETHETIGPAGGRLSFPGGSLEIPAGALATEVRLTATTGGESAPNGYLAYSPVVRFEPDGTVFTKPVTLSLAFEGDARLASLFWSKAGATGFERLGGTATSGTLTATIEHFSAGFVGNGVDYLDPPDRSCVKTRLVEGRSMSPSAVALFFTVDDCQGRPITGLTCASYPGTCDFGLKEDGARLSSEAAATILPAKGLQAFASLVLDLSGSTRPALPQLIEGAKAFVRKLLVDGRLPVQLSIQLFAGEATSREWQAPTLDATLLLSRLDALTNYHATDEASTNLNGAVIDALTRSKQAQDAFRQRNYGGAFTTGYVVLFTDGADTAGLKTASDALAAEGQSHDAVFAVALNGDDYDASAQSALEALAPEGVFTAEDSTSLDLAFARLANRIAGQMSRTYLLGYCSPKRAGNHSVAVEVGSAQHQATASYDFTASGFGPGCSAATFESACTGKECGGLGCGACDDRTASCDSTSFQCVDFCQASGRCEGSFTNPRGYAQSCGSSPEWYACNGTCRDLTRDNANCGACGEQCPGGTSCVEGECTCPDGLDLCGTTCRDLARDRFNCGTCGNTCPSNAIQGCIDGECSCGAFTICGNRCADTVTDEANCGTCGHTCGTGEVCLSGECTCEGTYCGGVCKNTLTDANNCGSCGTVCPTGCNRGVCMPTTVVTGLKTISGLAVAGGFVWYTENARIAGTPPVIDYTQGSVSKAALAGGSPTVVAAAEENASFAASDGTSVAWTRVVGSSTPSRVVEIRTIGTGGTATTLAAMPAGSNNALLTVDAGVVFAWNENGIYSVPVTGGVRTTIVEGSIRTIAVDATHVYWADYASDQFRFRRVARSGGAPETIATGITAPSAMFVAGGVVYWFSYDSTSSSTYYRMPVTGGSPTELRSFTGNVLRAVRDGATLYMVLRSPDGYVKMPLDGSSAPAGFLPPATPLYITTSGSEVVYSTSGTTFGTYAINRAPK